jgi:hypothetical protein
MKSSQFNQTSPSTHLAPSEFYYVFFPNTLFLGSQRRGQGAYQGFRTGSARTALLSPKPLPNAAAFYAGIRQRQVTPAEVNLNDRQKLLAFNDFFIGARSHVSARYALAYEGHSKPQSSSGALVSTGAAETGWLSSIFNMVSGIGLLLGAQSKRTLQLPCEDRPLRGAVREPFVSKLSQATLVAGLLDGSASS